MKLEDSSLNVKFEDSKLNKQLLKYKSFNEQAVNKDNKIFLEKSLVMANLLFF